MIARVFLNWHNQHPIQQKTPLTGNTVSRAPKGALYEGAPGGLTGLILNLTPLHTICCSHTSLSASLNTFYTHPHVGAFAHALLTGTVCPILSSFSSFQSLLLYAPPHQNAFLTRKTAVPPHVSPPASHWPSLTAFSVLTLPATWFFDPCCPLSSHPATMSESGDVLSRPHLSALLHHGTTLPSIEKQSRYQPTLHPLPHQGPGSG